MIDSPHKGITTPLNFRLSRLLSAGHRHFTFV
jgi:hypothetical protein